MGKEGNGGRGYKEVIGSYLLFSAFDSGFLVQMAISQFSFLYVVIT